MFLRPKSVSRNGQRSGINLVNKFFVIIIDACVFACYVRGHEVNNKGYYYARNCSDV